MNVGIRRVSLLLEAIGIGDADRSEEILTLSLPRLGTGLARQSQSTVDFIMVGLAVGPVGLAALTLAAPFWSVSSGVGSGLTNGAIGFISQRYGAERYEEMDVAVKQTIWLVLLLGLPVTALYWFYAETLLSLLGAGPGVLPHAVVYLRVISIGVIVQYLNKVAIRTLVGAGDSWIEFVIRSTAASLNIVLNAILIFGLGLGVFGAALGTILARVFVLSMFCWGFYAGRLPVIGEFPIELSWYPHVDVELLLQIVEVSIPLIIRLGSQRIVRFPMLAILATFGTTTVAAYGVARRAYGLMRAPNWGLSLAASSLVGQELGADDEPEAEAYGWNTLSITVTIYLVLMVVVLVLARPIASLFTQDPTVVGHTVPFVRVIALGTVFAGLDGVATGILRAGGDTRWPLYARLLGLYVVTLPLAYLALITPLGLLAFYLALVTESLVPAAITLYRVRSGRWKVVSRQYRPSATG